MFLIKQVYSAIKAFTLAEVLIVLLIIGVVSSLTIPAIISNTQKQEFYTLLKKDFGTLNQASKMMMVNNGGNLAGLFHDSNEMMDKFGNYIIFTKKCSLGAQGCFYSGTNTWKTLHGDDGELDHANFYGNSTAVLSNGGTIMFNSDQLDCERQYGTGGPVLHSCGWLHIDVNGFKGPNVYGKDLFALWITKTGIYPYGMQTDYFGNSIYCNKNDNGAGSGRGCAAKVLSGGIVD